MHILVPPNNSHTIPHELEKIQEWADNNNLKLNVSKSTEMILYKPGAYVHTSQPPAPLIGIKRVKELKILGVTLTQNLSFDVPTYRQDHYSQTAQSMYALRVLRAHGLKGDSLWDVSRATLVAKLTYASTAWWGYTSEMQKRRLHRFLIKLQRCGFLPAQFDSMADLCSTVLQMMLSFAAYWAMKVMFSIHCSHLSRAQVMTSAHVHTAELSQELMLECEEISFSVCCYYYYNWHL